MRRLTSLSVLTLVKGRAAHLANLLEGLCRGDERPDELVIVDMADEPGVLPKLPFPARLLHLPRQGLPLARARNLAARNAVGDALLFLDVDCIPMRGLIGQMRRRLAAEDAIICAEIQYLRPDDARGPWSEAQLRQHAAPHPVRNFPATGMVVLESPGLFWSLTFGIRRARFQNLNGFDEMFIGYGAEDTDFGFRAHRANVPMKLLGGAGEGVGAFHQHHPVFNPPLQHFSDIVRNAELFYARWKIWPMEGWLQDFEAMGLIRITGDEISILRHPDQNDLKNSLMPAARF